MDTSHPVANAWLRLRRQSFIVPGMALMSASMPMAADADADAFRRGDAPFDAGETLPMLYRSEAFAEDLFDSHPQRV